MFMINVGTSIYLHTTLSPIRRGSTPCFVNYKKRCGRLAAASDQVYQLLAHGRWFSLGTPASSTTETSRHDIADILLKVALNTINQIKSNPFISKRGPLVFVIQSHFFLLLSHVYILWKAEDQSWVSLDMKVCQKMNISYNYLTNNALAD